MQFSVSWDAVTLDDTGQPITVSSYNVYVDGVLDHNTVTPVLSTNVTINTPGAHQITVSAIASGGEGAQSVAANVVVPSGIPAQVQNVQASEL